MVGNMLKRALPKKFLRKMKNKIFFYKGVLLYLREEFNELPTSINKGYLKCYKNRVKCKLLEIQSKGDGDKWVPENFSINFIPGLRKSERK